MNLICRIACGYSTALARLFPEQQIICDHVSTPLGWGPYSSEGASAVFEEWKTSMEELSTCPNVVVKLSGLTMPSTGFRFETRAEPPTSEEVAVGPQALLPLLAIYGCILTGCL